MTRRGRWSPELSPGEIAESEGKMVEGRAFMMALVAREAVHGATCTDQTCEGILFPELNTWGQKELAAILTILLEPFADLLTEHVKTLDVDFSDEEAVFEALMANPPEDLSPFKPPPFRTDSDKPA